ncbi:DUF5672 family protein [Kiritimatiellota bacterium B12222]|nr:DUF5672 family protein [Kiritimatiellota bacterium B12222]
MKKLCAVVLFGHNPLPNEWERISLLQCAELLSAHPLYFLYPEGMDTSVYQELAPDLILKPFNPLWFSSVRLYNRLKVSMELYKSFSDYEYFLTYELDAFVFKDEVEKWCELGLDYIGAPWFEGQEHATEDAPIVGVGNSGFSLRKISSVRKVLRSFKRIPQTRRQDQTIQMGPLKFKIPEEFLLRGRHHWNWNDWSGNEDAYWSRTVPQNMPWFRIADAEQASRFSFEVNGPVLYERIGGLPFGCHKWWEYSPDFWRPHIESFGHVWPEPCSENVSP